MEYKLKKIKVPRFNEASGFYTTEKRSKMMRKIRSKNTKPEMAFRRALWAKGIRFRVHTKSLPGSPDISIVKYKLAVFIDGDFWHGKDWPEKKGRIKTNRDFWIPKIERNIQKDAEVNAALERKGFKVFRFWETEIKKDLEICVNDVFGYVISYPFFK